MSIPLRPLVSLAWLATHALLAVPVGAQGPVIDDFERPALGASWTILPGTTTSIVGNSDLGVTGIGGCVAAWTGSVFSSDQFGEAELSSAIDPYMLTQVYVRHRASDNARYGFHWNGDPGNSRFEIKFDGVPTAQTRILAKLDAPGPRPGDRLRLEVQGTDPVILRGFHQGRLVVTGVDSAPNRITTAAEPGLVARMAQGKVNTPPTAIFESWRGGTLQWIDRGNALAGTSGAPVLFGNGLLRTSEVVTLVVQSGRANAASALVLGLSEANLPAFGGVIVPAQDLLLGGITLSASGETLISVPWPGGTVSGFSVWSQMWILDPVGPYGLAASNGLRARVP